MSVSSLSDIHDDIFMSTKLSVMDASGSPSSGFVWGNNYWLGSREHCRLLNEPRRVYLVEIENRISHGDLMEIGPRIPVEYRIFYVNHRSQMQLDLHILNKVIDFAINQN